MKYAGNGLVSHGDTNLKLMRVLFWVFTLGLVAISYGNMPLSKQFKPGFPENTVIGQICMKNDVLYSKESIKSRLIGFVFPLLNLFWGFWGYRKILKYINGQCLNKNTFSAFGGKYRRNIFTYAEALNYNSCWCIFIIVENALLIGLEVYSEKVSQEVSYALHHLLCFLFIDIFHGIYLPFKHLKTSRDHFYSSQRAENDKLQNASRYDRISKIMPRRDFVMIGPELGRKIILAERCSIQHAIARAQRYPWRQHHQRSIISKSLGTIYENQIIAVEI